METTTSTTTPAQLETTLPQDEVDSDEADSDQIDPCELLTWEEVEEWTGFPRAADTPELHVGLFDNLTCEWWTAHETEEDRGRGLTLTVWASEAAPTARGAIEGLLSVTGVDPLIDPGDLPGDVFVYEAMAESFEAGTILDDHLALSSWTFGIGGDPAVDTAEEEQQIQFEAIRTAISRLRR